MEIKDIVAKEIAGEDVSTLVKDFTDDQNKEYTKLLISEGKAAAKVELDKVTGLRKAKADLESKKDEGQNDEFKKFKETTRNEQITKAYNKFVADMGLTTEDAVKLSEEFKVEDSGKIDAELIYGDMKRAYVKMNPDKFIEAEKSKKEFEKNASMFNSAAANGGGSGAGGDDGKKYSPQVYEIVKEARKNGIEMSLEKAEKGLKFGNGWATTSGK